MAGVGGGRRWRWRASLAGVAGGQQLSFARWCVFAIFDRPIDRAVAFITIVRASSSSASGGHMHEQQEGQEVRRRSREGQSGKKMPVSFLYMAGVGKNSQARDLPSAELGG